MEILDRAEALLDKALSMQSGNDGTDGGGPSNGTSQASPLTVYLSMVPEEQRNDREQHLRREVGACADCRSLVPLNNDWGCGNPEIAAMRPKYPIEACGLFERAG